MNTWILPSLTLLQRELVRFFRQPNRVIGAIGTPLVMWVLIGQGLSGSFQPSGLTSMQYLFPGTMTLIILFTSIFSTISVIEDRREGFLQSVLVAPVSRGSIVLGKILGGSAVALIQALIFLLLAPTVGIHFTAASFAMAMVITLLLSFALTGLGFVIAWRMESTQGFHAIMNLFLIPMWLLSGSFFPATGVPVWLGWIMHLNPLTYGVAALRQTLFSSHAEVALLAPTLSFSLAVTVLFGVFFFAVSFVMVEKKRVVHG